MKRSAIKITLVPAICLATILALTGCGPQSGNQRPSDDVLKKGIQQLIQTFEKDYPSLKNWDDAAVDHQLVAKLPTGSASEAGWHIVWTNASQQELSQVFVPWSLIGQVPETFPQDTSQYTGGKFVPASITQDLHRQFLKMNKIGDYFSALTNVRYSTVNSKFIIFESIPYLPVTDPAYGWASATTGSWRVIDYGTATVGCGTVPAAVQKEFGYTCP